MKAFVIPSIFTAVDKFTAPVRKMSSTVEAFGKKIESKINFSLSEASKQFLSFASTAAIVAGVISGLSFSGKSLMDYEDSVASFRTIVSDLSDKDFAKFQTKINDVAKDTSKSAIDVAQSFEKIAGLNSDLAKTADGLGAVSKAAIILSKASGDDLGKSAESLVGIMNQFGLQAKEADRVINVLAAGMAVGASNITQTADAFTVFGAVAKTANLSIEQSTGLVQVLGANMVLGSEAGTALKATIGLLQKSGFGYKKGLFDIIEALETTKGKYDNLKTAKQKDAFIAKTFGEVNKSTGIILLNNISALDGFTKSVTGTSEAQKAATIKSDTLRTIMGEAKNSFINVLTSSEDLGAGMSALKSVLRFVGRNMETIISVSLGVIGIIAAWKVYIGVLWAWRTVQAVTLALQGKTMLFLHGNTVAMGAYSAITGVATAAQWLWNGALSVGAIAMQALMSPVTLIIAAIGVLVSLVMSFYRNWDMITKAFKEGGVLAGFKAIGATILDAVLMPLQKVFELLSKIPYVGSKFASAAKSVEGFRSKLGVNTTEDGAAEKPLINPKAAEQEALVQRMENTSNAKVQVDFNNTPNGTKIKGEGSFVKINTSSTVGWSPAL
jgi:TP901 family phage tail tape measure protein